MTSSRLGFCILAVRNDDIMVQSARHKLEATVRYSYRPCLTQTVNSELVVVAGVTTAILSALVTGNERLERTSPASRPTPILT
jgi:hypothetical protein